MTDDDGGRHESRRESSGDVEGSAGSQAGVPDSRRPTPVTQHTDGPVAFVEHAEHGDVEWAVFEVDGSEVAGSRGPRCLIFWSEHCMRRVWEYPAHWRSLSDAELAALSGRR